MAFSLSGNTITQSGTDTTASTISGISAITGVTTIVDEDTTRLIIPYKLNITGTMTNSASVAFTFTRSGTFGNEIVVSGTWRYKETVTKNATTYFKRLPEITFTQSKQTAYPANTNNALFLAGGTIDLANVEFNGDGGQYWDGGTVIFRDVVINSQNLAANADVQVQAQTYLNTAGNTTIDIIGFTLIGGRLFLETVVITNFSGYKPIGTQRGFGTAKSGLVVSDFIGGNANEADISVFNGANYEYHNPNIGSDLTYERWTSTLGYGSIITTSSIALICKDEANRSVNGFKTYYADNATNAPVGFTTQNIYNRAATGNRLDIKVVTGALVQPNSGSIPSGIRFIKRSVTQTNDIFTFPLISYNNEITQAESLNLKGVGVKTFNLVMLTDFSITQTNKATVAAYTQLDSAAKLYDYAKSYLVDSYAGEAQTLLTRQDDLIDARALNMVFLADYSATATYTVGAYVYHSGAVYKCATAITTAQAFTSGNWTRLATGPLALDGTTLLVKAGSTFTGSLKTTGVLTVGSTSVSGSVEDSAGVRVKIKVASGGSFSIAAKRSDQNGYLPFKENVSEAEYTLPRGITLQYSIFCLGCDPFYGTYNTADGGTVITSAPLANENINTTLDVTGLLNNINVSIVSGQYTIIFNAPLIADIEQIKAVIHRLYARQISLETLIAAAGDASLQIRDDEIRILKPIIKLVRGTSLTTSDDVILNGYFELAPARQISASYAINPRDSNNIKVDILLAKPALDAALLASSVVASLSPTITEARDHARAANIQTQGV